MGKWEQWDSFQQGCYQNDAFFLMSKWNGGERNLNERAFSAPRYFARHRCDHDFWPAGQIKFVW